MRFYNFVQIIGNNVYHRGWDDKKGGRFMEKIDFKPTVFVPSKKESKFKTLDGVNVQPVQPGTIKESREFIKEYKQVDGMDVYGMDRFVYQYMAEEYPEDIEYDQSKINMWSLDIETSSENGFPKPEEALEEVLLITMKNFNTKNTITFGSRPFRGNPETNYIECADEKDLLLTFLDWWESTAPEVITGWNVNLFDISYLCNRLENTLGMATRNRLSPWKYIHKSQTEVFNRKVDSFNIAGVSVLDYLDIYKKFTFTNRESYRLDVIAEVELGEKKLDHSEFDNFKDFYTNNWDKFVDYNIHDVKLVDMLEEKMQLISLVMLMAYDAKVNYHDTFAQTRLWDVIIYNYLKKRNLVLNIPEDKSKSDKYAGAYVKEPIPGGYDWIVSFDLNSLYPSLIRFLNISPETLQDTKHPRTEVEGLINKTVDLSIDEDLCIAANGALYSKEQVGFMPELVRKIYDERVQYKKNMLRCKQQLVDIESEIKRRGLNG